MSRQEKGGWTNTCWQIQASDSVCVHAQETAPLQSLILFWNRHLTVLCLYIEMFMHLKASFKQSHEAQCGNQKLPRIIILQKSELIYMVWMIYPPSSPKKKNQWRSWEYNMEITAHEALIIIFALCSSALQTDNIAQCEFPTVHLARMCFLHRSTPLPEHCLEHTLMYFC